MTVGTCPRCHGTKFDAEYKLRPVTGEPVKVKEEKKGGSAERTIERTSSNQNQACWWCSRQDISAHCPECGFVVCEPCMKRASNPPQGPSQRAPDDQTVEGV